MLERLRDLYGDEIGTAAHRQLLRLLARFPPRPARPAGLEPFTQSDAILITYGDGILAPGRPPLAVLGDFARRHLGGAFSGIHLLPFFPYSSDYGFAVVDYLEVDPRLGGWPDIAALGTGFKLMFDFVLNHVSAESEWFQAYRRGEPPYDRFFLTVEDPSTDLSQVTRPRASPLLTRVATSAGARWVWTTFGADQVDLDYRNPEVLLRMVEVMLAYVGRGAGLLRMDAVGYLWKQVGTACIHLPQTHQVVRLLREVLDRVAPEVAIVTETNVPHEDNISYFGNGGDEAQMVYQFPLPPLVLDAFARSSSTRLSAWARGLATPSPRTAFFNFLATHDGIGLVPARGILGEDQIDNLVRRVRANGGTVSFKSDPGGGQSPYELNCTFFDALAEPGEPARPEPLQIDRFLCSQAIMLALAGVPGVYLHSLFGSRSDHEGFARTGWPRDLNHERLDLAALERGLADPLSSRARILARYLHLLRVRGRQAAFHPNAPQRILDAGPGIFALLRGPREGQLLLALHNVSPVVQPLPAPALEGAASGGRDLVTGRRLAPADLRRLEPYQAVWLSWDQDRRPGGALTGSAGAG